MDNITKTEVTKEIKRTLRASGLEPYNFQNGVYALPDDHEEGSGDFYFNAIQDNLPVNSHITIEWTGDSDTNGEGETTSDIAFYFEGERVE